MSNPFLRWSGVVGLTVGAVTCSGCHDHPPIARYDVCAPDVLQYSGPFKEPSITSPPDLHVNGADPGAQFQVNFPPESNAGAKRLTYWLTGDEDLVANVELALGENSGYPPSLEVLTGVFIDGTLVRSTIGGEDTGVHVSGLVVGSSASFAFRVSHAAIPDGAHSAALLSWVDGGKDWGGWSFTILKNGFLFEPIADKGQPLNGPRDVGVYDGGTGRLLAGPYSPPPSPTAHFEAVLGPLAQDCSTTPVNVAVVGVIDGAQAELSGASVQAANTTAAENRIITFDVPAIPTGDGLPHYLIFWALRGFGQYTEAPTGVRAPWSGMPVRIGIGVWGP